ncbi:MAG: ABC transporter permease [Pseudomonadota bacterium]
MRPRIKKVVGDLPEQPGRAFLVFLAIALGAAALTVALGARSVLLREIPASFATAEPPAAVFWLEDVDSQVLEGVRALPGVVDADARRLVRARVEVAPGDWRTLLLFGVRDFSDLRVSAFEALEGQWPPERGAILVERSGLPVLGAGPNASVGDTIAVRVPGGKSASLPIRGVVHDPALAPGWQDNAAYAYASRETLADLGLGGHLDELRITVDGNRSIAGRVADDTADWLAEAGYDVLRVEVPPRRHPHTDHMTTMLLLLSVFSALALVLSGALAASVIAAFLDRQARQVGVMKTIGARSWGIAAIYLAMIAVLAVPAIAIGLGAGLLGARSFSNYAAQQLNLDVASYAVGTATVLAIVGIGLAVPFVAAAIPIARAARMPVQKALQDPGITPPRRRRRWFGLLKGLGRPTVLAVRNSFRRPARLWLTLLALALGGAALMTASNVYVSLIAAVDRSLDRRGDDIDVRLLRPVDAAAILADISGLPGVSHAEAWGGALVALNTQQSADRSRGRYGLLAPPSDTALLDVPIIEGRWPEAGQIGDLVVNRNLQAIEPALVIGADVQLALGPRSVRGRIVGVIEEVAEPSLYTNPPTFAELAGADGLAGVIRIVTDPGAEGRLASQIEQVIVDAGSIPSLLFTRPALRQAMVDHFAILLALLSTAALAAVIVGGLGLAASMGLNVLERTREIGVIRAVGARPAAVRRLILTEGYAIALASVVLAGVLSVPLSMAVAYIVGNHGLHLTLPLVFSPTGVLAWTVLVAVLTLIACIGPARRAMRTPVCDAIAYE